MFSPSFANERNVLAFFSILCKRTFFFKNGKELNVQNGKERSAQPCKKGRDLYLDSGGGWLLHCSVFYEIRHFLHGRNIP